MKSLEEYQEYLLPAYSNLPTGRYVNLVLVRETESETIFRTEGSGEPLTRELVAAGRRETQPVHRVVISKRKQTAAERRSGRELLRSYGLLGVSGRECMLNTAAPCEKCVDCWLYGYAVGGGGAQKSRVLTGDGFSLLPAGLVVGERTFNAPYDNGTMRHPETGEPSTSINASEYVRPGVHFVDVQTLKDVTPAETALVTANVLNTRRYGAISSRIGQMRNHLVAVYFSRTELFSGLELTQVAHDLLAGGGVELAHPLSTVVVLEAVNRAAGLLAGEMLGPVARMDGAELDAFLEELRSVWRAPQDFLVNLTRSYPGNQQLQIG